jgi:hypothetical protein
MKAEYRTVGQVHQRLLTMIHNRQDTGFRIAATNATLEPRNPFETEVRRRPRLGIAIGAGLALILVAVFLFFSLDAQVVSK